MFIKKYSKKIIIAVGFSTLLLFSPITNIQAEAATVSSSSIVSTAKDYIGVKYVYGGTTTSGFDCSGYIQYVFKQAGVNLPRTTGEMYNRGTAVGKGNLTAGDLVFFNTSGTGTVSHAGIFIGNGKFIHASSSRGVMISEVNDPAYWGSRYVGAKRVSEVSSVVQTSNSTNGWAKNGNSWYYYQNGALKTGWVQASDNKWYYMNQSGVMQTGWKNINNKWYFMNSSGAMETGWSQVGGKWYFHNSSGAMLTGWIQTGGKWYFLNNNGDMAYNTTIGQYKLNSSGAWIN